MSKPTEIVGSIAETFDLKAAAAALRASPEYAANGRSAKTLAKAPEMNVLLTVIDEGATLDEHVAPGAVILTVIEGSLVFIGGGAERSVETGCSVAFAAGVPHSVRGVETATLLLVIGKPG